MRVISNQNPLIKPFFKQQFYRLAMLLFFSTFSLFLSAKDSPKVDSIKPTVTQQKWKDLKFGMFIHFGINTFYDKEWSDGKLDPKGFNPSGLDTDQWCKVARDAGMKYIVVITKHCDGFCMWPTKYTDYSISSSPFKGDYLKMVVKSARKYGLRVGLYYSLWDSHEKTHDSNEPAYVEFMKNQLRELLTNYGEIDEIWFDGFWKKQRSGWETPITYETGYCNHMLVKKII